MNALPAYAPGTKMSFAGLKKTQERANVIAWLRTQADTPVPLPDAAAVEAAKAAAAAPAPAAQPEATTAAPAAATGTQTAAATTASLPDLLKAADPAAGEKIAAKCKACHDLSKGGPNKIGPNLWDIVGNKQAHLDNFSYSDAVKGLGGQWTYENLDKFLTKPKDYAPGTKMTFPGLPKPEDRAALIAYLRSLSDSPKPLP
jgi:cytochrome c